MAPSTPRCLVKGSINIDEFFSLPHIVRPGETISSTGFVKKAGGKGANQAYAIAKAGGNVDIDGCIGPDGLWVKEMLEGAGAGTQRLKTVEDEVTGRAIIQSSADGENSIVLHAGANYHVPTTNSEPDLSQYTHLSLQNEIPLPSTLAYLTTAGASGVTSIFNPSPMLSPEELRSFPWDSLSWLIVNEGELQTLLEAFNSAGQESNSDGDIREKAERQLGSLHENEHFSRNVSIICTLGSQGILYFQPPDTKDGKANVGHLPAAKLQRPLRDTTGAGDCFAGYFTAGLMAAEMKDDLDSVLKTCLTACAICVESPGALESYPTRSEVVTRLQ